MPNIKYLIISIICTILVGCSEQIKINKTLDTIPNIFPDYINVTVPQNIAPLHFKLIEKNNFDNAVAILEIEDIKTQIKAKKGQFYIPQSTWKKLLQKATGKSISIKIASEANSKWTEYKPFKINITKDSIDSYIAYRLIEPGYEIWNEMGIYQRCLENYDENAIIKNEMTKYNCINCHSFCMQNPNKMLFHMRSTYAGTFLIDGDIIEKLNTKTNKTISALVYPSWHPSGKYLAFSVNDTKQLFHTTNLNRIEVLDYASDVVVYDVEKHEIITSPLTFSKGSYETFPTFSPDGKTLYFCSADTVIMPDEYDKVKYSLCAISFDVNTKKFGTVVDTLFNAKVKDKSVSFPRVSPDGKFIMFTVANYGNFSIWHKEADLSMLNLADKTILPMDELNSNDVESYHSWSSNSRWVIFSSRRIDGLYTRPFIAHIDENGRASKPFLLPQKDVDSYERLMKSYNIPEFIKDKVKVNSYELSQKARNDKGIDVTFAGNK